MIEVIYILWIIVPYQIYDLKKFILSKDYLSPYPVGYVIDAVLNFHLVQFINSVVVFSRLGFYREMQSIGDILG